MTCSRRRHAAAVAAAAAAMRLCSRAPGSAILVSALLIHSITISMITISNMFIPIIDIWCGAGGGAGRPLRREAVLPQRLRHPVRPPWPRDYSIVWYRIL